MRSSRSCLQAYPRGGHLQGERSQENDRADEVAYRTYYTVLAQAHCSLNILRRDAKEIAY